MKKITSTLLLAAGPMLLAGAGIASAETYTGCMTRSGTFIRFQEDTTPQRACNASRGEQQIQFEGSMTGTDTRCETPGLCDVVDATSAFTFGDEIILFSTAGVTIYPSLGVGEGVLANITPGGPGDLEGAANVGAGYLALNATTTGSNNTAMGYSALVDNTIGKDNTAVGFNALRKNTTGQNNTAVGVFALGEDSTSSNNTAIGVNALAVDTSGGNNIAVGFQSLSQNDAGQRNVAIGNEALYSNNSGSDGVAIGHQALSAVAGTDLRNQNTAVGYRAGALLEGGTGNIYLGAEVSGAVNENFTTRIGLNQDRAFMSGIYNNVDNCNNQGDPSNPGICDTHPVRVNPDGELTMFTSSRQFKEDIRDLGDVSQKVHALRPVDFLRKGQSGPDDRFREVGLIAEEVAAVFPQLALYGKDGKPLSVDYTAVAAVALSEVQRLQKLVEQQQSMIESLQAQQVSMVAKFAERLANLEAAQMPQGQLVARNTDGLLDPTAGTGRILP